MLSDWNILLYTTNIGNIFQLICSLVKYTWSKSKSKSKYFIQEIHIHIKYIGKTEAQLDLFVPSVSEFNKLYKNLFVDQQTEQKW